MYEQLLSALWQMAELPNILAMAVGLIAGVIFGAIPGLTSAIGISLLIPLSYGMNPLVALGMMAGIHNGGSFGGSIPSVLLRIPGTPQAICTSFDGYPMAQNGLAVSAIKVAAISSAVGGVLSAIILMLLAPPLSRVTLAFGPPEIFWMNVFGLASVAVLLGDDALKGLIAACFGLMLGAVGTDVMTGYERFTFDVAELSEGFALLVLMVGMYALPTAWEILAAGAGNKNASIPRLERQSVFKWPLQQMAKIWMRCSAIGVVFGILPGVGGAAGGFVAYNEARRSSSDPDSFGKGNPLGVAAAESANNADNAAAMVPALTLGVPGSGVAALMLGALLVHGLQPGPDLFIENAEVVYGYMWAMLVTSFALVAFSSAFASRLFSQVLKVPGVLLMPMIIGLTVLGVYTFQNTMFNVYVMFAFGCVGYAMHRLSFPIPPVVIGLVLGDKAESSLRQTLLLGDGSPVQLFTRPISIILLTLIVLVLVTPIIRSMLSRRRAR